MILKAKEAIQLFHVNDFPASFIPRVLKCVTCSEKGIKVGFHDVTLQQNNLRASLTWTS